MNSRQNGTAGWYLQRISAFYLVFGLMVHFLVVHFFVERPITFAKVQTRLSSLPWVIFDISLLGVAIFHGFNGVWGAMQDFTLPVTFKKISGWLLIVFSLALFVFGIFALAPFSRSLG